MIDENVNICYGYAFHFVTICLNMRFIFSFIFVLLNLHFHQVSAEKALTEHLYCMQDIKSVQSNGLFPTLEVTPNETVSGKYYLAP